MDVPDSKPVRPRPRHAVAPPAGGTKEFGPHPSWGAVAGFTALLGWGVEAILEAQSPGSIGTGFGNLGVMILVLMVAAAFALVGLTLILFPPTRRAGSIWAALWGGFAVGFVFGFLLGF